jgi:hypothetical protein
MVGDGRGGMMEGMGGAEDMRLTSANEQLRRAELQDLFSRQFGYQF